MRRANWTPETVKADAAKFHSYTQWSKESKSAYEAARNLGIRELVTQHMPSQKSEIHVSGKKAAILHFIEIYGRRPRMWHASIEAEDYEIVLGNAMRNYLNPSSRVFDPEFSYLINSISKKNAASFEKAAYWNLETCMASAAKYSSKTAWEDGDHPAHSAARKNGWLEQCRAHMPKHVKAKKIINLDTLEIFETLSEAGDSVGLTKQAIRRAVISGRPSAGYRWAYHDEEN